MSEGVRTVAEASVTPDSYVKPLLEDVAKGKYSHEVKTNKGAMVRAENVITRDGYRKLSNGISRILRMAGHSARTI